MIINNKILKLISNDKVIIQNYNIIEHIGPEKIIVSNYIIEGVEMIVKKIDGYTIEIVGQIKEIKTK